MKCKQCNKEYEGKRSTSKYCSAKCRKLAFQTDAKVSVPGNEQNAKELCQYCGADLPALSRPRRSPGACYPCAIAQLSKPRDNTLSSQPTLHTSHKLTVMERLFYRPAKDLLPGQTNFVSLPGRACYGVY